MPRVIVCDVNETLLDLSALEPEFKEAFGDAGTMQDWFTTVLLYSEVATLAGPLGLGGDEFGALRPPEFFPVTPWALTNPVWVTTHAGDFQAPGVVPFAILDQPSNDPKMQQFVYPQTTVRLPKAVQKLHAESRPTDRFEPRGKVPLFYPRYDNPFDVRKAFARYGHLGGHAE